MISRTDPETAGVPSPPGRARPHADGSAGFTLIEMIVVLAVLGLMTLLIAGGKPPVSRVLTAKAATAELASGLREARALAIKEDRPIRLIVDVAAHRFRIDDGPTRELPPDLTVTIVSRRVDVAGPGRSSILFDTDGSSSGGDIFLGDGAGAFRIRVDWLSGRVRVGHAS